MLLFACQVSFGDATLGERCSCQGSSTGTAATCHEPQQPKMSILNCPRVSVCVSKSIIAIDVDYFVCTLIVYEPQRSISQTCLKGTLISLTQE